MCMHVCLCMFCVQVCIVRTVSEGGEASTPCKGETLSKQGLANARCLLQRQVGVLRDRVAVQKGRGVTGSESGKDQDRPVFVSPAPTAGAFRPYPQGLRSRIDDSFFKTGYI